LQEVDTLLRSNPNFKARASGQGRPADGPPAEIPGIGSAAQAPQDKIEDLRDEARVRLMRVLSKDDRSSFLRFLWQMNAEQKYALVVDTSRSTLFVYENVNGEPRYVTDST